MGESSFGDVELNYEKEKKEQSALISLKCLF